MRDDGRPVVYFSGKLIINVGAEDAYILSEESDFIFGIGVVVDLVIGNDVAELGFVFFAGIIFH